MTLTPKIDVLGAALADPGRARMLCQMMDGRAFTGKELAGAAGITAQTASAHLRKLQGAGLISAVKSGRFVYHRIASAEVAGALETLSNIAPADHLYRALARKGAKARMLVARSCYDHLAGQLGVAIATALVKRGALVPDGAQYVAQADEVWGQLGVTLPGGRSAGRPFARACLDWTERKPHVAGVLGKMILRHALDHGWVKRIPGARGMDITRAGHEGFGQVLGVSVA